ncbi:MAG: hypothetical protein NTZ14_03980 [Hyphomicrobiales bacterium]|nr:hypothetical protein [Hyphomicrobiales bacterium]
MHSAANIVMPATVRKQLDRMATGYRKAAGGDGAGSATALMIVAAGIFGVIFVLDLIFGMISWQHWTVLAGGSAVMILFAIVPSVLESRKSAPAFKALAGEIERLIASGQIEHAVVAITDRHWFIEHEHGIIVLMPACERRTLYLDISSVADDPRHDRWWTKGRIFHRRWTWHCARGSHGEQLATLSFKAAGEPFSPRLFAREAGRYDPDLGGDLFEWLGSPADGDLLDRPFEEIDSWLRAHLPAMAA